MKASHKLFILTFLLVFLTLNDGSWSKCRVREVKLSLDTEPVSVSNWHTNSYVNAENVETMYVRIVSVVGHVSVYLYSVSIVIFFNNLPV